MNKATHSRLLKLEQSAGQKEAPRILVVADASEVPLDLDQRTIVIRTGVRRSPCGVVR